MPDFKRAITVISNNRDAIKRKAVVAVGSGIGMLLASAVIDRLNNNTPDVIYVEVPVDRTDVASDTPTE